MTHVNWGNRKFFGQPNGTKAPAKQAKLSFSSKSAAKNETPSSSTAKENEDIEMKEEELDAEVKPRAELKEYNDSKENAQPGKGTSVPSICESKY